ncbi:MAG: divalent-cation tolerance protein CutA [Desulfobulbaceae bacterium]|nr:divalent-cation tolerance protein CutA [Desulfobulbaceae bacterium]
MMSEYIQVMTSVESRQDGEKIADLLLERRLAACVQILGPMVSRYRWRGKVESATEYLCLIKSRRDLYDRLEAAIKGAHPYEVPEIMAITVSGASREYSAWLDLELGEMNDGG